MGIWAPKERIVALDDVTVLVVEDSADMRETIRLVLHDLNFRNVIEAQNGRAAVRWLQVPPTPTTHTPHYHRIDLIISDWEMPYMDGIEFLNWVRSRAEYWNTPFLMLTAMAYKSQVVKALAEGVTIYLVKPFSPAALAEKIEQIAPPDWWE